jgi:Rrf2 family protein
MLSRKAKYGLHAMLALARHHGEGPVQISDLAAEEDLPRKFLELILLELKKQGLLHSQRGRAGGYMLSRPPREISVGQIIRILDGPLAPVSCVSQTAYRPCDECRDERLCGIRMVMQEVRDAIATILDGQSLSDVLAKVATEKKSRPGE